MISKRYFGKSTVDLPSLHLTLREIYTLPEMTMNFYSRTLSRYAVDIGDEEMVMLLLQHDADPSRKRCVW